LGFLLLLDIYLSMVTRIGPMRVAEVIMVVFLTLLSWQSGAGLAMASSEAGPTYMYSSSGSNVTVVGEWVSSAISVLGFPETSFGWWTVLTAVMNLTHPNPANLRVLLTSPEGFSLIVGDEAFGMSTPCPNFYVATVADNQAYQASISAGGNIPCPPLTITPVGDRYYILSPPNVISVNQVEESTAPIHKILEGTPINGVWNLDIFDASPMSNNNLNGTLVSWSIHIDCENHLLFVSPPLNHINDINNSQ